MVTRCPACSTAFNVNSQQLASAKGAVRCGSCLQVFKAIDHRVNDGLILTNTSESPETNIAVADTPEQTASPTSSELSHDSALEDNKASEATAVASWDDYPRSDAAVHNSIGSDFQELANEDNEEDPFEQIDQSLAEQLDQELDEAFSEGLDIEPPAAPLNETTISNFETPFAAASAEDTSASEATKEPIANNDFFNELSQLAEQSLDGDKLETASFSHEDDNSKPSIEADLSDSAQDSDNSGSNDTDKELSLSFDDEPFAELTAAAPDHNGLNTAPLSRESEEEQAPTIEHKQETLNGEPDEILAQPIEDIAAPTLTAQAPEEEEARFIDDDTEHFKQKPETSHHLPQAFGSEPQEQDEDGLDESWALEMMMKELEAAEHKSEQSQIEQALDRKHPAEPELLTESESQSDPFFAPEASQLADQEPRKESEFDELDLSDELEDALSMDSIKVGSLSLAQDSEYHLEQAETAHDTAIEPNFEAPTAEQAPLGTVDTATIPAVTEEEPSKAEMIDSIEPEPLEMEFRQEKPSWNWLWGSGAFLAIIVAIGQLAWLKFDDLNLQPPYRGFYQTACNFIGCSLPPQVDLSKLKASNLVVRSHPEQEQALVVDMVLLNLANFEQEFPDIQLSFSDIDGKAIASRSFRPAEYLAGELAGASIMPIQRPIHLSLEIVDPGEQAVNYKVNVK
ncbi:DUF3426 domain-containing protein [uncultured Pseudoteredinibacter sp.]|uniref:DUF3426 domain-containing protein n=1 Tax=uncultured Pseudoteredinibacter sp. TaxID=1641701 RepID=UPI002629255F|nr:DUF3426 domain-containing protein [uncultured Pseudoteredinibacter sp.]